MVRHDISIQGLHLYLTGNLLLPQNYESSKEPIFPYYVAVTNLSRLFHRGEWIWRLRTKVEWRGNKGGRLCQENSLVKAMQGNVSLWGIQRQTGLPMLYARKEDGSTSANLLQEQSLGVLCTHS